MRWKKPSNYNYCVAIHKDHSNYSLTCPLCNNNTDYTQESMLDYLIKWTPDFIWHQEDISKSRELT